jgi:hypothetical protein
VFAQELKVKNNMKKCKNCSEADNWDFCPHCGQPFQPKRIDRHYVFQEIGSALYTERGMLYTVKQMLIRPGESIRQYLAQDRSRYVKPVSFLIITSLIYTLACQFFHIDAKAFGPEQIEMSPAQNLFFNWTIEYHGYMSIISGLFVACWVKVFFRKSGYNLFEIFVLFCYIVGISALIIAVFAVLQGLTRLNSVILSSSLVDWAYFTWAIGQFFDKKKASSYIKALMASLLGFVLFGVIVVCVAFLFDNIIN